jgi:hypothetical protein
MPFSPAGMKTFALNCKPMKRFATQLHYADREPKKPIESPAEKFASLCDLLFFFPWWSLRGLHAGREDFFIGLNRIIPLFVVHCRPTKRLRITLPDVTIDHMKGLTKWSSAVLFVLIIPFHLYAQQPLWRVDLRDVGYHEEADTSIKFYGPFLVVYSGSIESGSMRPRLVFEKENGRLVPKGHLAGVSLPLWAECRRTLFKKPFPEVNVIDCRNQMKLEQVGGIGRSAQKGIPDITCTNPEKSGFYSFGDIATRLIRALWVTITFC